MWQFLSGLSRCIPILVISALTSAVGITGAPETNPATRVYADDPTNFPNPERGFYDSLHNPSDNGTPPAQQVTPISASDLASYRANGISLVRRVYAMSRYRNSPIEPWFLDMLRADCGRVRDAGMKLIPLFSYNWANNGGGGGPDAPLNIVLKHLDQLRSILHENSDVIAFMPVGFIGNFGEEWGSTNNLVNNDGAKNGYNANSRAILAKELEVLPKSRMLQIRYPQNVISLWAESLAENQAYGQSDQARIGSHDDSTLHDPTDANTFSDDPSTRAAQQQYLSSQSRYAAVTGEGYGTDEGQITHGPEVLNRFRFFHFTGFNIGKDTQTAGNPIITNAWKNSRNRDESWYDTLSKRIGYRFRLIQVTLPHTVSVRGSFTLALELVNDGVARPINPRGAEVILRSHNGGTFCISIAKITERDVRLWLPGPGEEVHRNLKISLPPSLPEGDYDVLLNFPDPEPTLSKRPEYSIRLANQDVWERSTGYNNLHITLHVGKE